MSTAIALRGNRCSVHERSTMPDHLEAVRRAAEELQAHERAADAARAKLHQRILAAFEAAESKSAIARAAGVSRQRIARLLE